MCLDVSWWIVLGTHITFIVCAFMDQLGILLYYRKAQALLFSKAMTAWQLPLQVTVTQVRCDLGTCLPIHEFDLLCLARRMGVQLANQQGGTIRHSGCATVAMPATLPCPYGWHPPC